MFTDNTYFSHFIEADIIINFYEMSSIIRSFDYSWNIEFHFYTTGTKRPSKNCSEGRTQTGPVKSDLR